MSTSQSGNTLTKIAVAALSGKQFYIMQIDSAGKIAISSSATQKHVGVLQNSSPIAAGEHCTVQTRGGSKVIYGGTVDEGAWLTSDGNGKAIATTTDKDVVIGKALVAGVAGDIGEVDLGIFTLSV